MDNLKVKIAMLYRSLLATIRDWKIAKNGQSNAYVILQTAHRLEKGLTIQSPRKLWGWDKADKLFHLIEKEEDSFEAIVGLSVLFHYMESKRTSDYKEDRDKYRIYKDKYGGLLEKAEEADGGIVTLKYIPLSKEQIAAFDNILHGRHSIRQFAGTPVSVEDLNHAISQALTCPSACNRQPFHIYVVSNNAKAKSVGQSDYNADKWLYISADINAYSVTEFNDWIVSASIFAGYLSLTLHVNGIGSCIMRKDLIINTDYNKAIRHLCNMPKNEKLILEVAIGNYMDRYVAPVSKRKSSEDVITTIN